VLAVLAVLGAAASAAQADGDPASDYLITQPMFVTFKKVSTGNVADLQRLLLDAKRQGFPLKVAVIASPYDLGAIPSLFRKPKQYARFLGQEDFYFFKSLLLVVMPNGYGLFKGKTGVSPADERVVAQLPTPNTAEGDALVDAAKRAVQALASRRGLELSASTAGKGGSQNRDRITIVVGVLAACAVVIALRYLLRRRRRTSAA
jgi:hypothetical protein